MAYIFGESLSYCDLKIDMKVFRKKILKSPYIYVCFVLVIIVAILSIVSYIWSMFLTLELLVSMLFALGAIIGTFWSFWYVEMDESKLTLVNMFVASKNKSYYYNNIKRIVLYNYDIHAPYITVTTHDFQKTEIILLSLVGRRNVKELIKELKLKGIDVDTNKLSKRYKSGNKNQFK